MKRKNKNGFCEFDVKKLKGFEEEFKDKVVVHELDEFGHKADLPEGIRKLNILK